MKDHSRKHTAIMTREAALLQDSTCSSAQDPGLHHQAVASHTATTSTHTVMSAEPRDLQRAETHTAEIDPSPHHATETDKPTFHAEARTHAVDIQFVKDLQWEEVAREIMSSLFLSSPTLLA